MSDDRPKPAREPSEDASAPPVKVLGCRQKVLGRRQAEGRVSVDEAFALQDAMAGLAGGLCDRGVFRFHSFEEAQTWLLTQMTRRARARRRERTSSASPAASTPSEPATR